MRMIRPKLAAPQVMVAEDQEEFKPVTAALVWNPNYPRGRTHEDGHNAVVLAFLPSPYELQQIAAGEPIYLSLLTFGGPMQGVLLSVGSEETAGIYRVEV